jgi:hypothetical protein
MFQNGTPEKPVLVTVFSSRPPPLFQNGTAGILEKWRRSLKILYRRGLCKNSNIGIGNASLFLLC